jgi:DNA-binding transcriptional MocR family regulator
MANDWTDSGRRAGPARVAEVLGAWTALDGPLHRRLARALRAAVERAELPAGIALPPERALARALAVSRGTVAAAYELLKRDGLLDSRQGSGTYVRRAGRPVGAAATRANLVYRGHLERPQVGIDLAGAALPAAPEVLAAAEEVLRHDLPLLVRDSGYAPLGLPALREAVAGWFAGHGLPTDPGQVLVTTGVQQALALLADLLVRPGDPVLVESPTHPGALDVLRRVGARLVPLRLDEVEEQVARVRPRLVHVVPTFATPDGRVMGEGARRQLAALATELRVPVVADEVLADLAIDPVATPPFLAATAGPDAPLVTVGSASKTFWGGLRVGWLRAPEPLVAQLGRMKAVADLGSPLLSQAVTTHLLPLAELARAARRAQLGAGRAALTGALAELLPDWAWAPPAGGASLWARLPAGDARVLTQAAARHGVWFVPGPSFSPTGGHPDHLRLAFVLPPERLREGVARLAAAWAEGAAGGHRPAAAEPASLV